MYLYYYESTCIYVNFIECVILWEISLAHVTRDFNVEFIKGFIKLLRTYV